MEIIELLSQLSAKGIKLWKEDDQLRVNAPRGALTPELRDQILAHKAGILALLDGAQAGEATRLDPIKPAHPGASLPLSKSQQEIWPLIQRHPNSSAFQMVVARRLAFNLDIPLLEAVLTEVVRRHSILRTIFPVENGQPVQVICSPEAFSVGMQDLRSIPAKDRENHLRRLLVEAAARPLLPETGPLYRVQAYQLGDEDYVLLQALHFLISDCIGQAILEREVAQLYASAVEERAGTLPELPFQYADFAVWQQNQTINGNLRGQLDFWAKKLALPLPHLNTLGSRPLDRAHSTRVVRRSIVLPEPLTAALSGVARRANSSLYMALLTVFGLFLRAHSDQSDLLIVTPMAGRSQPGLDGLVGRFLNTLVLRLNVSGAPTFNELLERTRATVLDSFSNQDAPFVDVLDQIPVSAGGGDLADELFRVQLNFAPLSDEAAKEDGPAFGDELDLEQSGARYPLTLYINMAGEALKLMFIAQEGLFSPDELDAFLGQMKELIDLIVANPELSVTQYLKQIFVVPEVVNEGDASVCSAQVDGRATGESDDIISIDLHSPALEDVESASQPHRDAMERALVDIWKRILKIENVGVHDNFFALGGDSLRAMQMTIEVHKTFGINIPLNVVFRNPQIDSIAASLEQQIGNTRWDSLVEIQPSGTKPPLFCIHGIIGDTLWFEHLAHYLSPDQPIYGLQARGLDGIQQPQETVEEMAQLYIQEIRRQQPDGPYFIAGYSSGGNIAYEVACQLRDSGQAVGLLLIIDQPNAKSNYYTVRFGPSLFINILRNLPYRIRDFLNLQPARIFKRLANKAYFFWQDIKWANQHPGEGPRPLEIVELADYARTLPAHIQKIIELGYSALVKYYPRPYPGKLTLIRAKGGRLFCSHDPKMGWGDWVKEVDVRVIPGAHWGLFQEPHIRDLSAAIQACIEESLQTADH